MAQTVKLSARIIHFVNISIATVILISLFRIITLPLQRLALILYIQQN